MSNQDDPTKDDAPGSAGDPDSIYRAPSSNTSFAPTGDLLQAYTGPKNAEYYARHFARFKARGSAVSWHWPAFFLTSWWLLYRKMWLYALGYWIGLPIALVALSIVVGLFAGGDAAGTLINGIYVLVIFVLTPMYANRIYYRHAQNKVDKVAAMTQSADQQAAELARIGGTSNVVLVMLPILSVTLVGIMAAIAIPAYQDYTIRVQVSEGLNLSGAAKAAVAEHFEETGELAADNEAAGLPAAGSVGGKYVSSVAIDDGDIVVTFGYGANELINGHTLVMIPEPRSDSGFSWICSSQSIAAKHLPAACR